MILMEKIKCIIVDDEPPAIRLLEKYVAKVSFLELASTTTQALEVLRMTEEMDIHLIFLDIQMPDLTGIQLSKILKGNIKIIFTTAYSKFALESYALDAVDYLLKPIDTDDLLLSIAKVKANKEKKRDSLLDCKRKLKKLLNYLDLLSRQP